MILTAHQSDILDGKICPYCGSDSKLVDSKEIYGTSYGMIYSCKPCKAYVGVHKGTTKSLGRLADWDLRYWKKRAHLYFDKIWQSDLMKRKDAYLWLSQQLELPKQYTHIGFFGIDTCKKVVELSKNKLKIKA